MKRKIYKLLSEAKHGLCVLALSVLSGTAYSQTTYTFNYSGNEQIINLPAGIYTLQTWGADGGDNLGNGTTTFPQNGGKGGYSVGTYTLATAASVYVNVGGKGGSSISALNTTVVGGYNGGGYGSANSTSGKSSGAGGGGATHIAMATGTLSTLLGNQSAIRIVAGGGGGAGESNYINTNTQYNSNGGNGGGTSGLQDIASGYQGRMGQGGTQVAGGGGGDNGAAVAGVPLQGIFGAGGYNTAIGVNTSPGGSGAGGGGGGWYGGGAGWVATGTSYQSGSGGGGSGYIGGVSSGTTAALGQVGFIPNPDLVGNGYVLIKAHCNIDVTSSSINGPGPICIGNSATLTTNAISNYAWSTGSSASSIVVSPNVTTSYTLTATSPSNCIASAVITVTVNTTPTVSAMTSTNSICAGKTVTFTGGGANTYTWTGGAINGAAFTPAGTSDYTVTGTNACGTSSAAISVTVNPSPNVIASINNPTVCNGSSVILTGSGNASSYAWSSGVQNNIAFVPSASGSYTVTGNSANGCTTTAVASVTVLITPNMPPAATSTNICFGQTTTLTATGATGYTWTPGTALNNFSVAVSPQSTETYTIVRTNGACSSNMTIQVVVNPLPVVIASAQPSVICIGEPVVLNVFGAISYFWEPGGFPQSNITLYPNTTTNYTVTGTNGNCSQTSVVTVSVNPSPNLSIATPTLFICEGSSITFTGSGAPSFTWSPGGSTSANLTITPPVTAQYTLTGTNAFNCTKSITQLIVVNPLPNVTMTTSVPFSCAGLPVNVGVSGPSSGATYVWSTGPTGPQITVSPTLTTNYGVTGTFANGCTKTNNTTLAVYISTFAVTGPTAVCKGSTATLTAVGDATAYAWSNGGTQVSTTISPTSNTNYTVTGINGSCTSTVVVPIVANNVPNVSASFNPPTICRHEVGTATAINAANFSWIAPSNGTPATPSFTFNNLTVSTNFTVTGTDLNGCSKTVTLTQFVATCVGFEDLQSKGILEINVYPNPNNGNFTINTDVNVKVNLVNALGQVVNTLDLSRDNKNEITVSNLPAGIYFITGEADGLQVNKKIVIQK